MVYHEGGAKGFAVGSDVGFESKRNDKGRLKVFGL